MTDPLGAREDRKPRADRGRTRLARASGTAARRASWRCRARTPPMCTPRGSTPGTGQGSHPRLMPSVSTEDGRPGSRPENRGDFGYSRRQPAPCRWYRRRRSPASARRQPDRGHRITNRSTPVRTELVASYRSVSSSSFAAPLDLWRIELTRNEAPCSIGHHEPGELSFRDRDAVAPHSHYRSRRRYASREGLASQPGVSSTSS